MTSGEAATGDIVQCEDFDTSSGEPPRIDLERRTFNSGLQANRTLPSEKVFCYLVVRFRIMKRRLILVGHIS